jgi:hypothetical protein
VWYDRGVVNKERKIWEMRIKGLVLFWWLGCLSALAGLFLLRLVMRPRTTKTPALPLRRTPKSFDSQMNSAKRSMSKVRLYNIPESTEATLGDGCGLREALAGSGRTSRSSCTSSTGKVAEVPQPKTQSVRQVVCSSSLPSTGMAPGTTSGDLTPSIHDRISFMDSGYLD